MTNKKLWGETLYKVFKDYLTENGWLTIHWAPIVEENYSDWDENYNDTNIKKNIYQIMYLTDFIFSDCEQFVKPNNN